MRHGILVAAAHIFLHAIHLVGRDIQPVAAAILKQQIVARAAVYRERFHADKAADAVRLVHDVVPDGQLGKAQGIALFLHLFHGGALAEQLRRAEHGQVQLRICKAGQQRVARNEYFPPHGRARERLGERDLRAGCGKLLKQRPCVLARKQHGGLARLLPEADVAQQLFRIAHVLRRGAGKKLYDLLGREGVVRTRERIAGCGARRVQQRKRLLRAKLELALGGVALAALEHGGHALCKGHFRGLCRFLEPRRLVQHENGALGQIIEKGVELRIQQRKHGVRARGGKPLLPQLDLRFKADLVRSMAQRTGNGLLRLRRFIGGGQKRLRPLLDRPLRDGVKVAHLVDGIAPKLHADGIARVRRVYVHKIAAARDLSPALDKLDALIARGGKALHERTGRCFVSRFEPHALRHIHVARCEPLQERAHGANDKPILPEQQ